jgi:hypothetical protein
MSHLRLVHSIPNDLAWVRSCREAFDGERRFVQESLLRQGVRPAEMERLSDEIFFALKRNWASYDQSRPFRPFLLGFVFQIVRASRRRSALRMAAFLRGVEDETSDFGWTPRELALLDAGRAMEGSWDLVRARVYQRVALALETACAPSGVSRWRAMLPFVLVVSLAFAIGAFGARLVLQGNGEPGPDVKVSRPEVALRPASPGR